MAPSQTTDEAETAGTNCPLGQQGQNCPVSPCLRRRYVEGEDGIFNKSTYLVHTCIHSYVHMYVCMYIHTYIYQKSIARLIHNRATFGKGVFFQLNPSPSNKFATHLHRGRYIRTYTYMCHGAGAKVGWIKEYRRLTFTM